ncbi:hypothetical protein D3C78_1508030 [compost metagenome]
MPSPIAGNPLVGVAAMGLVDTLAAQKPMKQRPGGIDDEHRQQDQPAPKQLRRDPGGLERQPAENHPEEPAAGVAHEYSRRREVPDQEARSRQRQRQWQPTQLAPADQPVTQRPGQADRNRLQAGDSVDAIHEVIEIQ